MRIRGFNLSRTRKSGENGLYARVWIDLPKFCTGLGSIWDLVADKPSLLCEVVLFTKIPPKSMYKNKGGNAAYVGRLGEMVIEKKGYGLLKPMTEVRFFSIGTVLRPGFFGILKLDGLHLK
jgi:hypothetical protein